jgi:MFS family permease
MLPASLALLSHTFPDPAERSQAVTIWANTASLGFAAGPLLGGVLTTQLGWRSIFWVNVPVGIVALYLNYRCIGEAKLDRPRRIDWGGQLAIGLTLFALTYGLIEFGRKGWNDAAVLSSIVFAAIGTLYAVLWPVPVGLGVLGISMGSIMPATLPSG